MAKAGGEPAPRRRPAGSWPGSSAITLGRPLASEEEIGERLSKKKALAIFSSDAISSSAYATEEILRVLVLAGAAALLVSIEIAIAIAVLLAVVALCATARSCRAFPDGGGAYAVARSELTPMLGLVAAGGAAHRLRDDRRRLDLVRPRPDLSRSSRASPGCGSRSGSSPIVLITIGNLRGLRESGNIFAIPTYLFVVWRCSIVGHRGRPHRRPARPVRCRASPTRCRSAPEPLGLFLLLRAFAAGSVALTGVEAIANGVPAFKPPEAKNAANTLTAMAILLGILFIGITFVAARLRHRPVAEDGEPSVVSHRRRPRPSAPARCSTCSRSSTALILFLAANTSFNAFPRLAAILADDGYMPRQFGFRGDRLAYTCGIVAAGRASRCLLLWSSSAA